MASSGGNIVVAVRCRPLNSREIARGAKPLIRMAGNQTMLDPPDAADNDPGNAKVHSAKSHSFAFDHSYDSTDKNDPDYASQDTLFNDLGSNLLDNAFQGFNACIFAYGQTGSGKSYSMMGYGADRGIIPLTCSALFDRITEKVTDTLSFTVEVSFIEIYNERVRDLLNPKNKGNLKVREHPSLGPYVEDLSKLAVQSFADMERLMDEGNKSRTVAATQMNETSSRSHSVFTVLLTQKKLDTDTKMVGEKVSRISLVDLAGSERANSTGATGARLKEGANINKSLTTLGKVIAALAAASATSKGKKKNAAEFVPYRDSVLTWLLKDSLGGNSKTAMIAAISPADYEETLSTLRYADQAKKIQNKAVVNEDANAKLVRELKEELALLRQRVSGVSSEATYDPLVPPEKQVVTYQTKSGEIKTVTKAELQEQLETSEKLMADVNQTWEEKMQNTVVIQKEREQALQDLGIVIEKGNVGVHTPKKMPHLVNLCEDPLMSECLIYQIKLGKTIVGNVNSEEKLDIRLSGDNVLPTHCFFESSGDGTVMLHSLEGGTTMVNGLRINHDRPKRLKSGYRIILGDVHVFRFNHPEEVRKHRDSRALGPSALQKSLVGDTGIVRSPSLNGVDEDVIASGTSSPAQRPPSPTMSAVDWNYARKEAVVARLNGTDVDLDKLEDRELNRLFNNIMKVRTNRRQGTSAGRPESRMSFMESIGEMDDDDVESGSGSISARPVSGDTWSTDDTSLDSTLTFGHAASQEIEIRLKEATDELQRELDAQREEYETKLKTLANSASVAEATRVEKIQMEEQLHEMQEQMQAQLDEQKRQYERRMQRMASRARTAGDADGRELNEHEELLAKQAITKWRALRRVKMAQVALSKAVLLKEANVFSREFDKRVTYQFTIVDEVGSPLSALEGVSALAELEDVSDPALLITPKPFVAIKVFDERNTSIYVWSIDRLQQRLQQMQRLSSLLDKPAYSQHFSLEDPFYHPSPLSYSFIGTVCFPLVSLARKEPFNSRLRMFSRHTGQQIATCSVKLKPLSTATTTLDFNPNLSNDLDPGAQLSFEITIDSLTGLDPADFAAVHCQLRLSSIVGASQNLEDVLASPPAELDNTGSTRLRLRKTVSIPVSDSVLAHVQSSYAYIEFFARCRPAYLIKCEKWDETREEKAPLRPWHLSRTESDLEANSTGRRAEGELRIDQRYDVKSMLSIEELSSSGAYAPVTLQASGPLDPGVFQCNQGLQRRIKLVLSHGSGRQLMCKDVASVRIGNVRLLDPRGNIMDSKSSHEVALQGLRKATDINYNPDGTTTLIFEAGWDSSAHNSLFLDRTTATAHRVLLEVRWQLHIDGCVEPLAFRVEIGLSMRSREARSPSKLFSLFNPPKTSSQFTQMFELCLTPAMINKASELWRINTASVFVRGEHVLNAYKPRGITLIEDYYQLLHAERLLADVAATCSMLTAIPPARLVPATSGQYPEAKVYRVVMLWQTYLGHRGEVKLVQDPAWLDVRKALTGSPGRDGSDSQIERRMTAQVRHVRTADTVAKRGYLHLMQDAGSNGWQRIWVVLRRPYLSLYTNSNEVEELPNVINVSTVKVDHSTELEDTLNRKFAFGIYTPVSALFFASQTSTEMISWLTLVDPSWHHHG